MYRGGFEMAKVKTKDFAGFQILELKADKMPSGEMIISGYASVFNVVDSWRDVILQGAFTKTISENTGRVKLLWQHDQTCPIGKVIELKEDSKGLFFSARISDTDMGKEAYTLCKDGVIDEISIGFVSIKDDYINDVRMISELKLWEISLVTLAANEYSKITEVKAENLELKNKLLEIDSKLTTYDVELKNIKALLSEPPKPDSNPNIDSVEWNQLLVELKNK
jgi:HK97 family phage prohead protease